MPGWSEQRCTGALKLGLVAMAMLQLVLAVFFTS